MPGYCTATARSQPPGLRLGADPAGWLEAGWTFPADWPRTGLRGARRLPLFPVCRVWM